MSRQKPEKPDQKPDSIESVPAGMPRAGFALHQAPVAALEASLPAGEQHLLCRAVANDGAIQPARGARDEWFGIRIEAAASATQAKG